MPAPNLFRRRPAGDKLDVLAANRRRYVQPQAGPSLDLDFTGGVLPAGCAFARASAGTRVNAAGWIVNEIADVPRFDHDPATLTLRGLLVEEQSTNLLTYSNFNAALPTSWTEPVAASAFRTLVASAKVQGKNAIRFAPSAARPMIQQSKTGLAQYGTYTLSALIETMPAKPASSILGHISYAGASGASAYVPAAGDAGKRPSITFTLTTDVSGEIRVGPGTSGNDTCDVTMSAPQLEARSSPSSYIPTDGSAVTRAADQLSFSVPAGATTLRFTFDDLSTQDVAVAPGPYLVPANLNRRHIRRIQSV